MQSNRERLCTSRRRGNSQHWSSAEVSSFTYKAAEVGAQFAISRYIIIRAILDELSYSGSLHANVCWYFTDFDVEYSS